MSNNIRLRTTPGGVNQNINVSINQDFDFIEILSLKISQDEAYRRFSSDYGVVVGRVIVNNGVGVPNAKVSVFIPIDDEDKLNPEIFGLYPFEVISDKDDEGFGYSLLPSDNTGKDECYSTIGKFDSKRQIQDNPESEMIYCKYYKFTTTTNDSGDYMIFGLPIGAHNLHVEADLSDIGFLSQKPFNLIDEGSNGKLFKSPSQFKNINETVVPSQLKKVSPVSVNVIPFWGDEEQFEIGITRLDVDLLVNIKPTAIFMGSVITDNEKNSINKKCRPRKDLGKMDELTTGPGTIEMIRKTPLGNIERYDIDGGQVIDENGTWCYQIPMNLEYKVTSESGQLVPSNDPKVGIATSAEVRFRVGMDVSGSEGKQRRTAKFLIPNNPDSHVDADYTFDSTTKSDSFRKLYWNKIYSIKNHITRVQPNKSIENRNFIGIKASDDPKNNNPFPYNKVDTNGNPLFFIILAILSTVTSIVWFLNISVIYIINLLFSWILPIIWGIQKNGCAIRYTANKKKRAACRCYKLYQFTNGEQGKENCARAYYNDLDADISDLDDKDFCNNSNYDCDDECGKNDCKDYVKGALIPYIKLKCGGDNYFIWSVTDNKKTCDDLSNKGGQQGDCKYSSDPCVDVRLSAYLRCQANQLLLSLNMLKFDFYNDWVNGNLYLFLLEYTFTSSKKEKFCDIECNSDEFGDYDDLNNLADNKCRSNYIIDTCTGAKPQQVITKTSVTGVSLFDAGTFKKITEGYIKRGTDGELYYASHSKNTQYKLFATDIINLGSINKFDWQGQPQIYRFLVNTTFQLPPLSDEKNDDNPSQIDTSGINGDKNLFFNYSYFPPISIVPYGDSTNCNNIKRVCELGIGLDEDRQDESKGPVDGKISNQDVDNPFTRGIFAFLNRSISPTIPLIYIDSGSPFSNSDFENYGDSNYRIFRGYSNLNDDIWQYDNSYYFYFGLRANNTALTRLNREYLTPCVEEVNNDFQCQLVNSESDDDTNTPTGELDVNIIGGVKPLTYEWNGPTINGQQYPLQQNIVTGDTSTQITGLYSGTYNLKTTDSVGNITECSFQVGGPPGIQCNSTSTNSTTNGSDDGQIIVDVTGGIANYTYELYDNDTNNLLKTDTSSNKNYTFDNLGVGNYKVVVKDGGVIQTQCEQLLSIIEPDLPTITVTTQNIECFGETGSATLTAKDGSGTGNSTIEWKDSTGNVILTNSTQISNLSYGVYEVTYTDSLGQSVTEGFTITTPPSIYISPTVVSGSTGYEVSFIVNSGTPPYNVDLYDHDSINNPISGPVESINNITAGSHTFSYLIPLNKKGTNAAVIEVTDNNDCNLETYINLP